MFNYKATLQIKGEPPKAPAEGWEHVGSANADKYKGGSGKVFHNWQKILVLVLLVTSTGCENWGTAPDGGIEHWTPTVRCADAEIPFRYYPCVELETDAGYPDLEDDAGADDDADADAGI